MIHGYVFAFVSIIFINILTEHVFSSNVSTANQSLDLVPCERGWFHFREKCYKVGDRKYTYNWKDSADRCVAMGGHLATIVSEEEQDFIVSFLLLDIKKHAWIGLEDQMVESQYTWHDGSVSNFRKWRPHEPNAKYTQQEDCVEMRFEPEIDNIGGWNDRECSINNAYICQKQKTKRKISPDPRFCSPDVGGGWKFQQSCYHVIKEKKSWYNAEEHCKKHYNSGHLVTVLDVVVDKFLNYIVSDLEEKVWIGINIKDQFQQQWSSGWYVAYDGLSEDLRGFKERYCVERKKFKEWTAVECSKRLFFICETSEILAPVLPPPPPGFYCPEGINSLRDFGGEYCYFIETKNHLNRYRANFECERRGGSLVSIHSKEEIDILGLFLRNTWNYSPNGVYIGLLRSLAEGEDFIWSDGTDMDFQNWNQNEPNLLEEKCGVIQISTLGWGDVPCHRDKGYICSIRKIEISSSVSKTDLPHIETSSSVPERDFPNYGQFLTAEKMANCMYDMMVRCTLRHR